MPAYDYRCRFCETCFEVIRSFGEAHKAECPACGSAAKRVFTPVGVVFKGSGFHNTDYRKPSATTTPDTPTEPSTCPSAGTSGSCASCPAAD